MGMGVGGRNSVVISASADGGFCELGHERQQSVSTVLKVKQRITKQSCKQEVAEVEI